MKEIFRYQVQQTERRKRLDEFLFERIGSLSKMHLRGLLSAGECLVNGIACQAGYRLETGDAIEIAVDLSARTSMKPEFIPLEILFEDDELMVIDKPAEMLVHPTKGVKSGTLLNALSFHLNHKFFESQLAKEQLKNSEQSLESNLSSSEFIRPGLVHRLDKQTSGLMVIAKNPRAHRILSDHFLRKLVEKKYFALVGGIVETYSGSIQAPIGYGENVKQWDVQENGKQAETRFRVLKRNENSTLLELEPVTGRTNQLRIHCAFINHPIIGDINRGGRVFTRLCLHAYKLSFWHPNGSRRLVFETEIPKGFSIIDANNSNG